MSNEYWSESESVGQPEARRRSPLLSAPLVSTIPVAVAWFVAWFCYDLMFVISREEELYIPDLALVVVALVFGFAVGVPVAKLTGKVLSGSVFLHPAVMAALILGGIVIGEAASVVVPIMRRYPEVPIGVIIRAVPDIVREYEGSFIFLKALFGGMLLLAGWIVVKEDLKKPGEGEEPSGETTQDDTSDLLDGDLLD